VPNPLFLLTLRCSESPSPARRAAGCITNCLIDDTPGNTETMKVSFRLDAGVHETFRQPAELRVHYLTGNKEEIARITLLRGPNEISH
jgi:hypothetical protein